jgi:iron complex transport system substrate-binding protein
MNGRIRRNYRQDNTGMSGKIAAGCAVAGAGFVLLLAVHFDRASSVQTSEPSHSRTVTDEAGCIVHLPTRPERIVSLCTSATDTIVRLGEVSRLKAIDEYGCIVPGVEGVPVLGRAAALSRESVLAARADLAFIWWYQDDAAQLLEESGVPVVRIRCGRASDVAGMIRLVGECIARGDKAESPARSASAFLDSARNENAIERPRVYVELYGPFKTEGAGTYLNDLIVLAGGENVAADASGPVLFSPERLIRADPDVILYVDEFSAAEAIAGRSGLQTLRAVRKKRIKPISRYWLVAGAGLPEMVEHLRSLIKE